MNTMKTGEKVFVIVYRPNKHSLEFLCLLPNPEPNRNSDYYVITGGVENGESFEAAALRETEEEIGIKTNDIIDLHNQIKYKDHITFKSYTEHCYAVKVKDEAIILNEEHVGYKWVSADEFVNTIWWDKDKRTELQQMLEIVQNYESQTQ